MVPPMAGQTEVRHGGDDGGGAAAGMYSQVGARPLVTRHPIATHQMSLLVASHHHHSWSSRLSRWFSASDTPGNLAPPLAGRLRNREGAGAQERLRSLGPRLRSLGRGRRGHVAETIRWSEITVGLSWEI